MTRGSPAGGPTAGRCSARRTTDGPPAHPPEGVPPGARPRQEDAEAVDSPFDLPDVRWTPVSGRLVTARRIVSGVGVLVLGVLGAGAAVLLPSAWWLLGAAAWVALLAWQLWLAGRQVRAIGYAEREDDLLVRRGILFRSLSVVPYGRMQYVDVSAGPLERWLGIATVQLHTASASTDATIPGLVPEEASRLRDRLSRRGESRLAGL
ncbi:PH domain-containing protein [Quadrisphaera sp. INWT6]|nr:PH domain-containing protein [Quadrisphaera sp. INWT6]